MNGPFMTRATEKVAGAMHQRAGVARPIERHPPPEGSPVPGSFDEFVVERLDGLLRYATVLTDDPHLAQDIVQEVLLRAQQRWAKIEAPPTYVRRMITNEYLSWRRRRAARSVTPELLEAL